MYKKLRLLQLSLQKPFLLSLRGGSVDYYLAAVSVAVFKGQSAGGAIRNEAGTVGTQGLTAVPESVFGCVHA